MNFFDRFEQEFDRVVDAGRKRWRWFDHFWSALLRYQDVLGVRLAAAISYYAFFAAFSLAVMGYSILGRVLGGNEGFIGTVNEYLSSQLSWVADTAEQVGTQEITILGAVALTITGIAWIDALRSSTRAVWLLPQHPGHWIIRYLVDGVMLILLGLLLTASLAAEWALGIGLDRLAGPDTGSFGQLVLRSSGPVIEFGVNFVLSAALLTVVPRLRLSAVRLIPTALLVAFGIQLLNTLGRWYINQLDNRPAYQLVTGTVGLLIYLYLLNQLILFGCALAATAQRGSMVDLSGASPPDPGSVADSGDVDVVDNSGEPHDDGRAEPR